MLNKKGSAIIYIVIFGVIILISVFIFLYYAYGREKIPTNNAVQINNTLTLYLQARDYDTKNSIEAEYILFYANNTIISKGKLISDWNELKVNEELLKIYCWNNNYYFTEEYKYPTQEEVSNKKVKFTCDMKKIGKVSVSSQGKLQPGETTIYLNVSSEGEFKKPSACFGWTAGIISVAVENNGISCDKNWVNYSYNDNGNILYLPEHYYQCFDEIQKCEDLQYNTCFPYEMQTPKRYLGEVDLCRNLGKTLSNTSQIYQIKVKSSDAINDLDAVTIYIIDQERRMNENDFTSDYNTEIKDEDIGAEDYEFVIK